VEAYDNEVGTAVQALLVNNVVSRPC